MSSIVKIAYPCKLNALLILFCSSACYAMIPDIDEDTTVFNNSLYGDSDVWSTLYQQCGRRTSYQCVQNSMYSYLDKTLEADFVTDLVDFRQNENNYTEMCRRVKKDDPGDFNVRESRLLETPEDGTEFSDFIEKFEEVERIELKKHKKGKSIVDTDVTPESATVSEVNSEINGTKNIQDVTDILYDRGVKYLMTHDMEVALPSPIFGGGRVKISPRGFDEDGGVLVKFNVVPDLPQEQGRLFFKQIQKFFKKKLMTSMLAAMLILKLLKLKMMFFLPVLVGVGTAKKILLKVLLFLFPALAHLFKLCSYYHHKHAKYHHHHHQIAHHHHHVPVPVYTPVHSVPGELPAPYPSSYDYSHSRTEVPGSLADLASWGLGEYPAAWDDPNSLSATEASRYTYPTRAQQVATTQYPSAAELQRWYAAAPSKVAAQYRPQPLTPRPAPGGDPFYGPMLRRLDAVFNQLGVQEEGCRERLVCSMYKYPSRYSPHSNLVSAELSRDPSELQQPTSANSAVVRFYRYLQAARDGQEHKECLRIYAACTLTTE